jgi:hypothetical protein
MKSQMFSVCLHKARTRDQFILCEAQGGGKSLALTMISIALASFTDILPLPVTFVCPGSTDDLQAITTLFPQRPDVGLALAVVSRMASAFYGLDRDEVVPRFYAHESALWKAMDGALSGKDVVAAFAIYLAQQAGVKKVVLLVDGYNHCNWELGLCYSPYLPLATDSVASCLGDAMLSFEFDQFGLSGALVLCGNTPAGAAFRTGKRILPVKLRDSLDPTSVVAKRFLVDIDVTDRSRHAVIPKLPLCGTSETSVALRVLEFIAAMYNGVPRGLECVHDELRRLVDRSATPRELVLTPEKVSTVLRNAMAKFREEYFRLPGAYIPPDHMYATLFGAPGHSTIGCATVLARVFGSIHWAQASFPPALSIHPTLSYARRWFRSTQLFPPRRSTALLL